MKTAEAQKLFAPYENVIFDFGGIFVNLDFKRTSNAFKTLGSEKDFSLYFSKAGQTSLFNDFETGSVSKSEFLLQLRDLLALKGVSDEALILAWSAMLLDLRMERFEFLKELKKTKRVFLLSNINQLHEEHMLEYILKNPELKEFYPTFDHVYFSHHIGLRKPHREIFDFVCKDSVLPIEKTIFIDDSLYHVEGARKFGLTAYHLDPSNSFIV